MYRLRSLFTLLVLLGCGSRAMPPASAGDASAGTGGTTAGASGAAGSTAGSSGAAGSTAGASGAAGSAGASGAAGSPAGAPGEAGTDGGTTGLGGAAAGGRDGGGATCGLRIVSLEAFDGLGRKFGHLTAPQSIELRAVVENTGAVGGDVVVNIAADESRVVSAGAVEAHVAPSPGARETASRTFSIPAQLQPGSEIGFVATARLAADPACAAPAFEPLVVTMGDGDALNLCPQTRLLLVSDPHVAAKGGGAIAPGSDVMYDVLLTNSGPTDDRWYPSVRATSDHPGVAETYPNGLYFLGAGKSDRLSNVLHVAATVPHGTEVHVSLTAFTAQVRCRNENQIGLSFVVP
jgi:hypothetical protein